VDLFAGAGGAALGLREAGIDALACVELDPDACAILRAAGFPAIEADVRAVDWSPWAGSVDLLWASPPCQAFSVAGKRLGAADERNGWPWTLDAIDALCPTWTICENVPGLTFHRGDCSRLGALGDCPGCYWERWIIPEFQRRFRWVGVRTLDAADFGVPQRRHRVFLVGGPRPLQWPEPTHCDPAGLAQIQLFGAPLLRWRTVRDALGLSVWLDAQNIRIHGGDEPCGTLRGEAQAKGGKAGHYGSSLEAPLDPDGPSPTLRAQGAVDASGHQGGVAAPQIAVSQWPRKLFLSSQMAPDPKHPDVPVDAPASTLRGGGGHDAPHYWLRTVGAGLRAGSEPERLDMPAPTVSASEEHGTRAHGRDGTMSGGPDRASDALYLATGFRRLTVADCALLQDFPPDWPWAAARTKTARYRCVGNAVPPPMAKVLGEAVVAAIRVQGRRLP